MGVVLQAAAFADVAAAAAWESALIALREAYIDFEATDPQPWSMAVVPAPLAAFAAARQIAWPLREDTRFLVRGGVAEATEIVALFSITFEGPTATQRLVFDGSGMQDWAFVAALPQLDGEDPRLDAPSGRA